jgi:site-specific recombinase XerD
VSHISLTEREAGDTWQENNLVFPTSVGTEQDVNNVRRDFQRVMKAAGLTAKDWTPRELRHSFVSILSDDGMPIEEISRLVGHRGTAVTEHVYRKQIRPVIETGAVKMDSLFPQTHPDKGGKQRRSQAVCQAETKSGPVHSTVDGA